MVTFSTGRVDFAAFDAVDDLKWHWRMLEAGEEVIAWLPIPEPYKGGE